MIKTTIAIKPYQKEILDRLAKEGFSAGSIIRCGIEMVLQELEKGITPDELWGRLIADSSSYAMKAMEAEREALKRAGFPAGAIRDPLTYGTKA